MVVSRKLTGWRIALNIIQGLWEDPSILELGFRTPGLAFTQSKQQGELSQAEEPWHENITFR